MKYLILFIFSFNLSAQTHSSGPPSVASFPLNKQRCELVINEAIKLEQDILKRFQSKEKSFTKFINELYHKVVIDSLDKLEGPELDKKKCDCKDEKSHLKEFKTLFTYYNEYIFPFPDSICPEAKVRKSNMKTLNNIIFELTE